MNISKYENLPYRESSKEIARRKERIKFHHNANHRVDGLYPWDNVKRVLKKYKGKHFDDAFSYFCELVPQYQQKWFLEEFEPKDYYRSRYSDTWYVDKDGLIQVKKAPKNKKPISFASDDYKVEFRHKVTGHKRDDFKEETTRRQRTIYYYEHIVTYYYGIKHEKKLPKHLQYSAKPEDFEPVIISGWIKYFKSKKDREYKRLMAEKIKREKKKPSKKELAEQLSEQQFSDILHGFKINLKND